MLLRKVSRIAFRGPIERAAPTRRSSTRAAARRRKSEILRRFIGNNAETASPETLVPAFSDLLSRGNLVLVRYPAPIESSRRTLGICLLSKVQRAIEKPNCDSAAIYREKEGFAASIPSGCSISGASGSRLVGRCTLRVKTVRTAARTDIQPIPNSKMGIGRCGSSCFESDFDSLHEPHSPAFS